LRAVSRLCQDVVSLDAATPAAGERLFVDYATPTFRTSSRLTGEVRMTQMFTAILGGSSFTFVWRAGRSRFPSGGRNAADHSRRRYFLQGRAYGRASADERQPPPLCQLDHRAHPTGRPQNRPRRQRRCVSRSWRRVLIPSRVISRFLCRSIGKHHDGATSG
jgi:hypothetical protein